MLPNLNRRIFTVFYLTESNFIVPEVYVNVVRFKKKKTVKILLFRFVPGAPVPFCRQTINHSVPATAVILLCTSFISIYLLFCNHPVNPPVVPHQPPGPSFFARKYFRFFLTDSVFNHRIVLPAVLYYFSIFIEVYFSLITI